MFNHDAEKFSEAIGITDEKLKDLKMLAFKQIIANFTTPLKRSECVEEINKFLNKHKFTKKEYAILFELSIDIASHLFKEGRVIPVELGEKITEKYTKLFGMQVPDKDDISIQ